MKRLIITASTYETLRQILLEDDRETCAVIFATNATSNESQNFLVVEYHRAPTTAYSERSEIAATLKPEFFIPLVRRAREESLSVVFVHTHPNQNGAPKFSKIDDEGEKHLGPFLNQRVPNAAHLALVLAKGGSAARVLMSAEEVEIIIVGSDVIHLNTAISENTAASFWDRQIRAFGSSGQSIIRSMRVGIVGCGGTGAFVAQELAHLGISTVVLIDPDCIDETNLNRVVGATKADIGKAKVDVIGNAIERIGLGTRTIRLKGSVIEDTMAASLLGLDAIFACTDSHGSRAVLNQLAYQYYIPVFDVGVSITASDQKVSHITGRVQMLSPGLGCLVCAKALDWTEVRRDMQTEVERKSDPYIVGITEPQPAVVSINGTLSSLLVTMFLSAFTGIPSSARLQYYNGITGTVRSAAVRPQPDCIVCSGSGSLGRGASWQLSTRR